MDSPKADDRMAQIRELSRALVRLGNHKEVNAILAEENNANLAEIEAAKTHPLESFTLSDEDWGAMRAHMLDGGGVQDHRESVNGGPSIRDMVWHALNTGDRTTFWKFLPHLVKSSAKAEGFIRNLPSGGISMGRVGRQQEEGKK